MMRQASPLEARLPQAFPQAAKARIDRVGMLGDVQREAVWQHLRALHCEIVWVADAELDHLAADGWQPVIARRVEGEYLFTDRDGARVLMFKAPA
jgi:hypothetical protein